MTTLKEAMNSQFLYSVFDKMLARILTASAECEDACSADVQSQLWMNAGITFGSGHQDLRSAQCAFEVAIRWDPEVALDTDLSTAEVVQAFENARRAVCGST